MRAARLCAPLSSAIANGGVRRAFYSSGRASMEALYRPSSRIAGFDKPTVFATFSQLSAQHNAVNMGQGFPNFPSPRFVKEALCEATMDEYTQYTRSQGHPALVQEIARQYSPRIGHEIDAMSEVVVGVGATEVLFMAMQGLLERGDEEPMYDSYAAQAQMSGGKLRSVPMIQTEVGFEVDLAALEQLFSEKTRMFIVNTPHNPTGKVFTRAELEGIRNIVLKWPRCLVLSDEVYERHVYGGVEHVPIASLPDMFERTISVYSAGKIFSCTGFKVGWAIAPSPLIQAISRSLKRALEPYEGHATYYEWMKSTFQLKRDALVRVLKDAGFPPLVPDGGFFVMAQLNDLNIDDEEFSDDWGDCRWLTMAKKVSPIPASAFYSVRRETGDGAAVRHGRGVGRFAFCKKDEDIAECGKRLLAMRSEAR